jgi:hypothetical protein
MGKYARFLALGETARRLLRLALCQSGLFLLVLLAGLLALVTPWT